MVIPIRPARIVSLLLVALTVTACSAAATPVATLAPATVAPAATQATPPTPGDTPMPSRPEGSPPVRILPTPAGMPVTGEVPQSILDKARTLLAATVGQAAAAAATVVVGQAVTWPDGSLGCPQPGMAYPQMVTPGYQVVFAIDSTRYDFRASAAGYVVACERARPSG